MNENLDGARRSRNNDTSDPFYIHPSDSPGMFLVSKVFDGDRFVTWKRIVRVALSAKNKVGFIDGTLSPPLIDSLDFRAWERCNDMVMSWITSSVSKEIEGSIIFANTARDMWLELCTRFEQSNLAQSFLISKELCTISQGNDSITAYSTRVKGQWDELAILQNVMSCTCGNNQYALQQEHRLIQLLMGLNDSYIAIRGSIFLMNPTPSVAQVFAMLVQEEKQRDIKANSQFTGDSVAMNAQGQRNGRGHNGNDRSSLMCTHCRKPGHSVDFCWQLHGKPEGATHGRRAHVVCDHCKKIGHTRDNCYRIIGFPNNKEQAFGSRGPNVRRMAAQTSTDSEESSIQGY